MSTVNNRAQPKSLQTVAGRDAALQQRVYSLSATDADYWSFRGRAVRHHAHAYFQYPAMMVPEMQGDLIGAAVAVCPEIEKIFDPFVGSGTVLIEAMLRGRTFLGDDINPLAVLLCRAKAGPFFAESARLKAQDLVARIVGDTKERIEANFPGLEKWFNRDVAVELSRIHRSIKLEKALWCRQFFWVALAETVRTTSNSRTSTFKLHVRPTHELANRCAQALSLFRAILQRNLERLKGQTVAFAERGLLKNGHYIGDVKIRLRDCREPAADGTAQVYDLLVSSPPYGDNGSTVPYGQHSFLPLQWIELSDIDECMHRGWLATTHEIDRRSLGGSKRVALQETAALQEISPHFCSLIQLLRRAPADRASRVGLWQVSWKFGPEVGY